MKKFLMGMSLIVLITGCARNIESNVYHERQALEMRSISKGVVLDVIPVQVKGDKIVGTASGAVLGGIAGSAVGGNDTMHVLGGAAGALIGAGVGRVLDGFVTNQEGYQYIIKLSKDGEVVSIVQGRNNPLAVGDHILLIDNPDGVKIIKDNIE